jgi:DnaJ-class molecular chaperone
MRCPYFRGSRASREPSPSDKHDSYQTYARNMQIIRNNPAQRLCPDCGGGGIDATGHHCETCRGVGRQ